MCSANSICWVEVHSLGRNSWINKEILKAELVGSLNHCSCYCKSCFVIKHNIITKKAIILTLKLFMAKVTSGMSQSMPCNCCISYTWNAVSFVSWPVWYVTLMRLQQFTSYTLKFFVWISFITIAHYYSAEVGYNKISCVYWFTHHHYDPFPRTLFFLCSMSPQWHPTS